MSQRLAAKRFKAFIDTGTGIGMLVAPSIPRALAIDEIGVLVELYAQAIPASMGRSNG